jgi:sulfur carrier protein ThiS adenylyltransferase
MNFEQIKNILSHCTVGIAGAGGLGSNCAVALVRSGLGKLVLADFDRVEFGNLNRQYYFQDQIGKAKVDALKDNLLRINPDLDIETHEIRLNPDNIANVYESVDVLVEAFDLADQKIMLIEIALDKWPSRPLVIGSGMAGFGRTELLHIRKSENLYICGDEISEISDDQPPIAPRVGIVANMQADKVLELLVDIAKT